MRRLTFFLQNGILAFTLAIGIPVSVPAVEPDRELPPPVSYAPTDQYPLDDARCRTKLEQELPSAARFEEYYHCKIDFARLEHDYPLTRDDLKKITPENIKVADQEKIDQIYARLTAGPIPDGPYEIQILFSLFRHIVDLDRVVHIAQKFAPEQLEQFKGLAFLLSKSEEEREELVQQVWHGKVFDKNQRIARTRLAVFPAILVFIKSLFHGDVGFSEARLRFPAKVYCGQSLLDGRRESIIIDYGFSHELKPYYREYLDKPMGSEGLQVRDEIRMVRPGFYLGRAYAGRIFVLNFILYNEDIAKQDTEKADGDCWLGFQGAAALSVPTTAAPAR